MVVARHSAVSIVAHLMRSEKILDRRTNTSPSFVPLFGIPHPRESQSEGGEGGWGLQNLAAQSRTQVRTRLWIAARRPARKSARGSGDPHAATQARTQTWTRSWRLCGGARAGEAFPPPRLWKLTGCGKLRATGHPPPDLPTTVGNPGLHPPPRDSHSYAQPLRREAIEEEQREIPFRFLSMSSALGIGGRPPLTILQPSGLRFHDLLTVRD
jgi:hypothetical protein